MKIGLKISFSVIAFAVLVFGTSPFVDAATNSTADPATISIDRSGNIKLGAAKVTQVIGSSFYARTTWGGSFIRFIVKTNSDTVFTRRFGGPAVTSEILLDHYLNIEGYLDASSDTISIRATAIQDLNLTDEMSAFSGKIKSLDLSNSQFTLTDKTRGDITVVLDSNLSIIRNARIIDRSILKVGDTITKVDGVYDIPKKVLTAKNMEIYLNRAMFAPKNFQGILKHLDSVTLPTQAIITIADKDYTVKLPADASVLDKKKNKAKLGRFLEGDTVRIYGAIQEDDFSSIVIEVIRNIDL